MKKTIIALALAASVTGCATQSYNINGGGAGYPDRQDLQHFFISGIGQTQKLDAAAVCGGADKVAKVESHLRFLDGLIGVVTLGIYTPRTAKVYCTQ